MTQKHTLMLYLTAICNLNCKYCFIDKSNALKQIDNLLLDSFQSDYYFDFSKQFFNSEDLQNIEFWGGEPSLGLSRFYLLLPKFIDYYYNLNQFSMSTNFTTEDWFEQFKGFLEILKLYPNRNFLFNLQLSIDGPEHINDFCRGKNTTKKFLNNFYYFYNHIEKILPKNVKIQMHFKSTLTSQTLNLLQTKENILNYYSFFEELYSYLDNNIKNKNISYYVSIPNTAAPGNHTIKDGKNFANYTKLAKEIQLENILPHHKSIMIYYNPKAEWENKNLSYFNCSGHCGTGIYSIGLLPEYKISLCHMGFTNLLEEYKTECYKKYESNLINKNPFIQTELFSNNKFISTLCLTVNEYNDVYEQLNTFYTINNFSIINLTSLIQTLALTNQIDKKFLIDKEALMASYFIKNTIPFCIRDNLTVTGSMSLYPLGIIKLLLNGAYEYLIGEK